MKLQDLVTALDALAPLRLAEPWDNVGLLAGDPTKPVRRVLLTIDLTKAVVAEAEALGADVVVCYHPPIFKGVQRIPPGTALEAALRAGLALYSPHTALDSAEGGTNDVLADALGLEEREPLRPVAAKDDTLKLVTFVPEENVAAVSDALFAAGAGRIGSYSACSFRSPGTGTFFGEAGTSPAVGQAGRLETAPEVRLETVVPLAAAGAVVVALRNAHPYEEPAFDLVRLAAPPATRREGMGRIGRVPALSAGELVAHVQARLGLDTVLTCGPLEREVTRAAALAGSAGDLVHEAARRGAGFVLTGEIRHHDALAAAEAGVVVMATLHSRSERPTLASVAARLLARLPGLACSVSAADADPLRFVSACRDPGPGARSTP
jgi:dinuclear metal center YbgI/SA1388 family protein